MRLAYLRHRFYGDFVMPSRLDDFARLLDRALEARYVIVSVERFWHWLQQGAVPADRRYLILRHDVDTDPGTARAMWSIERSRGIDASFFFRLSTLDVDLMHQIVEEGGQASYHYEEIATIAKRFGVRTRGQLDAHLGRAQTEFRRNIEQLRVRTGLPMRVVASHGDFINRKLGVPNWVLLADRAFRAGVGVDLEAYDDAFMSSVTSRHSDTHYPTFWIPADPFSAIDSLQPVVYLLVHPRHWQTNVRLNLADNAHRLYEGLRAAIPRQPGAGPAGTTAQQHQGANEPAA